MDQIFIQHRFTVQRDGQTLQDALVMPLEDYQKLSEAEIEAQKESRFTTWSEAIKNPVKQEEPAPEEKIAQIEKDLASLEEQKQVLTAQKVEAQAMVDIAVLESVKEVKLGGQSRGIKRVSKLF
mgnify:CR=1 FL=1